MYLLIRSLVSSLLIISFLCQISPAYGATLPRRPAKHTRDEYESSKLADIAGLDRLRTYVCPIHANDIKRQVDTTNGTFTNSAIPLSQVPLLWTELQLILADLGAVLRAGGLLDPSAVAAALTMITRPLVLTSSFDISSTLILIAPVSTAAVTTASSSTTHPSASLISSTTVSNPSGSVGIPENERAVLDTSSCVKPISTITETITVSSIFNEIETSSLTVSSVIQTVTLDNVAATSTTSPDSTVTNIASVAALSSTTSTETVQTGGIFVEKSTTTVSAAAQPTTAVSSSSYSFNAASKKNVAVYFGQTPVTGTTNLAAQCADPNIDIAILAFIIAATYQGKYPQVNFGAACGGQTDAMVSEAPGLLSCPALAADIKTCQEKYGKKVLLSIGGATSQISFAAPAEAGDFANVLWDLFGPPGNIDVALRPFGDVSVDGFDIDIEIKAPANWDTFANTLRANFASSTYKPFYLASAPQCPFPDASISLPVLLACDFVFVQFYNNPQCEIGSSGFTASLQQWSSVLGGSKAMFYLGAPAFDPAGPTAYAGMMSDGGINEVVKDVVALNLQNFGGVMFWDGPEGKINDVGGKDIIEWASAALHAV